MLLVAQRSPTVSVRPALQTQAIFTQPGEHSQLVPAAVPNVTNPCTTLGSPYINACDFDAGACSKQRCAEHSRGVSPPPCTSCHLAAGSALQWLYYGRLSEPSADVRDYYASEPFRVAAAASAAVKARGGGGGAPGSPALRGSRGSLYGFDQSLFVDGTVWSDVFGLSQVREARGRVRPLVDKVSTEQGSRHADPPPPPPHSSFRTRSPSSTSQTRASRRPTRSRPCPASCTPRCTAASRRCRTSATSS